MSRELSMTLDLMEQRSREVKRQGEDFGVLYKKMGGIVKALEGEWKGKASQAFAQQFEELRPSFEKMIRLFEDVSMQLDQTAKATQKVDEDIASKFGIG